MDSLVNKNILIINTGGFKGGGTENRVKSLIKEMLKIKCFNLIYFVGQQNNNYNKYIKRKKLFLNFLPYKFKSILILISIIKQYKINIVQLHNLNFYHIVFLGYLYFKKIPVVFFLHDFWPLCSFRSFMHPLRENYVASICTDKCLKCVGLKNTIKQYITKTMLNKVVTIGISPGHKVKKICEDNSLLLNKWQIVIPWISVDYSLINKINVKKTNKRIMFIGSMLPYKGAWVLGKAIKYIKHKDIEVHYIGPDQKYKEEILKGTFSNDNVKIFFHGKLNEKELFKLLAQSNLVVFPSVCMELFGQVWTEAMSLKIPVIASDIGGVGEYIKDFACLFNPGDYRELAEKIDYSLNNYDEKIINYAFQFVNSNCNIDVAFNKMINIYNKIKV